MYCLMIFDTEDFMSPPDAPVHRLPGQFADIMAKHGLAGCFHMIGEKARFMERHGQRDVIESLRGHDLSLHTDRGSIHPTTAEEISNLGWFEGVDRVMFRELPGFQTHERIFGRCTAFAQHGGTFAAQIVFAAGRLGKPFTHSPFELPGKTVFWFCQNLVIGRWSGGSFDHAYRDTPLFDEKLAQQQAHLRVSVGREDLVCLNGCHPVNTVMEEFPCANFYGGAAPPPEEWRAPKMIPGVSIPLIMANFERRIKALADFPGLEWTTIAGIVRRFDRRPVRVDDALVTAGARAVLERGGPTWTPALSAGELLCLLARRRLARAERYEVPPVMGPLASCPETVRSLAISVDLDRACREIIGCVVGSGYLPECLSRESGHLALEATLVLLACDALGAEHVHGISMPSRYSSQHSRDDAAELARRTGLHLRSVPIGPMFDAYMESLGLTGLAEENLQSRLRGTLLMAVSNQEGPLVLAPGNKSELAVGYSTLYGDSVGAYGPIKDVYKSVVFRLAKWRNAAAAERNEIPPIPENSISKPPSAELRPDQLDTDSLPDYDVLDAILELYVDRDRGSAEIVERGYDPELVERVLRMVDTAEYKRRQYPPGTKISPKGFGKDRRLPITNRWRERA